MKRASSLAQL